MASGLVPGAPAERAPPNLQARPRLPVLAGPPAHGQIRPSGTTPSHPGAHRFGPDCSSPSFPCSSAGSASLAHLYSDIIPDEKPKKKRNRKKDGDDSVGGARTPLSSHSDDITAPPTPAVSDTSCSTPTGGGVDQSDASLSELERQLSVSCVAQQRGSVLGMEGHRGPLSALLQVKVKTCCCLWSCCCKVSHTSSFCVLVPPQEEREEGGAYGGSVVKMEEGGGEGFSSLSPLHGGDRGKELLRHLLKDKSSPSTTPSPTGHAPAHRQLSNDGVRSEEEDGPGSHGNTVRF